MLYPMMLLGLLGLSVPVIIHLIHRQKLRPQLLATTRFIESEDVSNVFKLVPRDVLQLLLRLLVLLILVLLMVRFVKSQQKTGPRSLTIVLDRSLSMQQSSDGGGSLFEKAKENIAELIDGMGGEDQVSLVLVGDKVYEETGFLRDRDKLHAALDSFTVSEDSGGGVLSSVMSTVKRMQSVRETNTAVLVFSDYQRAKYPASVVDEEFEEMLANGSVRLIFVGKERPGRQNVAVEDAQFHPSRVYPGTNSKLMTTIHNYSDEEQQVEVLFSEGEQSGENRALTLGPRETSTIDLAHFFESPVDVGCRVSISDDVLPADNVYYVPMRVRDRRQVLLVAPAQKTEGDGVRASARGDLVMGYAINPGEALGLGTGTKIAVRRVTPDLLQRVSLPLYATIVLHGVPDLPESVITDLYGYVENGGGLWLVPESTISPRRFNQSFAPLLNGFQLGGMKDREEPVSLGKNEAAIENEMLLPMMRGEWGEVGSMTFTSLFAVADAGNAKRVLSTQDGEWLAGVVNIGRGQVFLQTFTTSVEETSLPRTTAFVPMVQEVIDHLAVQQDVFTPDVVRVNQYARVSVPEFRNLRGKAVVSGPEEHRFPVEDGVIKVKGISRAGMYRISHPERSGGRPRWLAVNPAEGVSDLATLSSDDLQGIFGPINADFVPYEQLSAEFEQKRELFPWLLFILFSVFACEAFVGAWQSLRKR